MRLASVQIGGNEVAAVVWACDALPVAEIPDPDGWPTDFLSLLEGGRLEDLLLRWGALEVATVLTARCAVKTPSQV